MPQREIDRNNAVFTQQNNSNPVIDNLQSAFEIWQTTLSTYEFKTNTAIKMYPNYTNGNKIILLANKNLLIEVYTLLGKKK